MTEDKPYYAINTMQTMDGYHRKVGNPIAMTEVLTLRDQFAMAALTGAMNKVVGFNAKIHASDAYEIADAMLEARK